MKKFASIKAKALGIVGLMAAPFAANASVNNSDPFYEFSKTVEDWASGGYGKGVAITSVLIGGGVAAAKNSPMPAVAGIGLAALMHWGPGAINSILGTGSVLLF